MTGDLVGYFGYGSLVNRHTLRTAYVGAVRAELTGFRREWGLRSQSAERNISGLTVSQDPRSAVQGLVVIDRAANLADVDRREDHYDRVAIEVAALDLDGPCEVSEFYVYSAKPDYRGAGSRDHPILQSYLDAVFQGYRREFGDAGLRRFVTETTGWHATVLRDRAAPIYPRAVELTAGERRLFDELLEEICAIA